MALSLDREAVGSLVNPLGVLVVKSRLLLSVLSPVLLAAGPAVAAPDTIPGLAPRLSETATPATAADVDAFMAQRRNAPLWFGANAGPDVVPTLVEILRRAPLDGLAEGPALADAVEAAARDAAGAPPALVARSDRILSAAWVAYSAALKAPLPGYTYSDPYLTPRQQSGLLALQRAAVAPSLSTHLISVSTVNPIYAGLRDAAWLAMKRGGATIPNARVLTNLARARIFPAAGKFIVVNAATQQLTMVDNARSSTA